MGFPYANIKSPQDYGAGKGTTVLGRSLTPSEVDANLLALADAINAMLGQMTPAEFGVRSDPTKLWVPIGTPYKQGPFDPRPDTLFCGTWTNVSSREPGLGRRVEGGLAGSFFTGVPAILSISISGGVPTPTIIDGGNGYLNGQSGTFHFAIAGACTTQMVADGVVTNGVLTGITIITQGAGYTNGAVAFYDGIAGHGDLAQPHIHNNGGPVTQGGNLWPYGGVSDGSVSDHGNYTTGGNGSQQGKTSLPKTAAGYGSPRIGAENTGPFSVERYWIRTA